MAPYLKADYRKDGHQGEYGCPPKGDPYWHPESSRQRWNHEQEKNRPGQTEQKSKQYTTQDQIAVALKTQMESIQQRSNNTNG